MTASGETLLSDEHGHGHGHGHGEDQGLGTVAKFGEFRLISLIKSRLAENEQMVLGPGDDAALVSVSDGRVVATTDLLVADRHFRVGATSAIDLGVKAAAANLADIAAMGAVPTALLVGLALPADTTVVWVLGAHRRDHDGGRLRRCGRGRRRHRRVRHAHHRGDGPRGPAGPGAAHPIRCAGGGLRSPCAASWGGRRRAWRRRSAARASDSDA